jgi:hypothetical protein
LEKYPEGNSLAAYPTARTVLRGRGSGDIALLPDKKNQATLCSRAMVVGSSSFRTLYFRSTPILA